MEVSQTLISILTAAGAVFGSWLALTTRLTRVETKMDMLAAKVEKHNNMVERTYKLETGQETAWKRHDELADRVKRLEDERRQ